MIKYKIGNPQIGFVSDLLKSPILKDFDRCHLSYAYAKMNEDVGNFEVAFENYVAGGAIRQNLLKYDQKRDQKLFKAVENTVPKLSECSLKLI